MGFLNAVLLFGASTLAVPLIIHLLNRSKFQVLDWGAMHLLQAAELQNSRRIQWQSILLLLIRCGIPLLLAIAMARPILTAWQIGGGGNSAIAFVVDDSYSMQAHAAAAADGVSASKTAIDNVETIASGLGRSTQMSVITLGGQPKNLLDGSTFDSRLVGRRVTSLPADQGPIQPIAAFELAGRQLANSTQPQRNIVVLSDFQKKDWSKISNETFAAFRDSFKGLPVQPRITLMPIQTQPTENLQVSIDAEFSEVIGVDDPLDVRATIHNWSSQPAKAARVVFQVDDVDIAAKNIDVPAQSDVQVLFGCKFDKAGDHRAIVRVEETSPIQADNVAELPIQVLEKLFVLLVEPVPVQETLQSETGFLELALQINGVADRDAGWMQTKRVHADALTEQLVRQANVIVVANVPRLSDQAASWIENRVKEGAGLLLFAGSKTDRDWFNQRWSPQGAASVLPFRFAEPQTTDVAAVGTAPANQPTQPDAPATASPAAPVSSVHVASGPYNHSALALFNRPEQGRLDQVIVRSWIRLTPWSTDKSQEVKTEGAVEPPSAEVANSTKQESPPDPASQKSENSETAATIAALSNGDPFLAQKSFGKGTVIQCATTANDAWTNMPVRPAFVPLIQRLVIGMVESPEVIQANANSGESDLQAMNEQELESLANVMGAQIQESAKEFLDATKLQSTGREIWRWVLLALVIFLFSELLLEKRLTRGGR
jgi:Aerotolerance regulator N-terminal